MFYSFVSSAKRNYIEPVVELFEFFHNSLFSAKSLQNPTSIDREEQNENMPSMGIEPTTSWLSLYWLS